MRRPCRTAVLNDFEAVGYGIPALAASDLISLNDVAPIPEVSSAGGGAGGGSLAIACSPPARAAGVAGGKPAMRPGL